MSCRFGSLAIAALSASGCFHPTYDHPVCGRNGACPDGLSCNPQGVCDSGGPGGPGGSGGPGGPGGGGLAAFRLIAPMSLSTVTQRQPTLRWLQTPGDGTPTVELCKDRACTVPLGIGTVMAANRLSAVPTAPLPRLGLLARARRFDDQRHLAVLGRPSQRDEPGRQQQRRDPRRQRRRLPRLPGRRRHRERVAGAGRVPLPRRRRPRRDRLERRRAPDRADLHRREREHAVQQHGGRRRRRRRRRLRRLRHRVELAPQEQAGIARVYLGGAASQGDWNAGVRRIDIAGFDGTDAHFGSAVSGGGDIDGDGFSDFVVGADYASATTGTAHVFLGTSAPHTSTWTGTGAHRIDLTSPDGAYAIFGSSLARLAPARPAGTLRPAGVTLARAAPGPRGSAHGKPSSHPR